VSDLPANVLKLLALFEIFLEKWGGNETKKIAGGVL